MPDDDDDVVRPRCSADGCTSVALPSGLCGTHALKIAVADIRSRQQPAPPPKVSSGNGRVDPAKEAKSQAQDPSHLDAALAAAARGWPVLPLNPRSKVPVGRLVPHGLKEASTDPEVITRWWTEVPDANVGSCPPEGHVIVDCDAPLEAAGRDYGSGPCWQTGRNPNPGWQRMFRIPDGMSDADIPGTWGYGAKWGEIKKSNGYGILPPSIHPDTGRRYQVIVDLDAEIPELPEDCFSDARTQKPEPPPERPRSTPKGDHPADRFNSDPEWTWERILEPKGWTFRGFSQGLEHWERPENGVPKETRGISATAGIRGEADDLSSDILVVFSTNAHPLKDHEARAAETGGRFNGYSKYDTYVLLWFDGDQRAANDSIPPPEGPEAVAALLAEGNPRKPSSPKGDGGGDASGDAPWPEPRSLSGQGYVPADLSQVPPALREMVEEVARATDTHPDLSLLGGMSAVSAATFGSIEGEMYFGGYEPLSIFALGTAASSDRKSGVLEYMITDPMGMVIKVATSMAAQDVDGLKIALAIATRNVKKVSASATATPDELKQALLQEMAAQRAVREIPLAYVNDATMEPLVELAERNRGPFIIATDEAKFLQLVAGFYSQGQADTSFLNCSYDGRAYRKLRTGTGTNDLPEVIGTLCIFVQPELVAGYANAGTDGSGFLPRFLLAMPPSSVGYRLLDGVQVSQTVADRWQKRVIGRIGHHCFQLYWERTAESVYKPRVRLPLSPGARQLIHDYGREVERKMRSGGSLAGCEAWAGKHPSRMTRVADGFALIRHVDNGGALLRQISSAGQVAGVGVTVEEDDMARALSLAPWMENEARRAMGLLRNSGMGAECEVAAWALNWAAEYASDPEKVAAGFSTRHVQRKFHRRDWARSADMVELVLEGLVDAGWLRLRVARNSKHWVLNPRATRDDL